MNTKNFVVFFLAIASVLLLANAVSAALTIDKVEVDKVDASTGNAAVIAGDTVTVKVYFSSDVDYSDVKVKAEIEGDKANVVAMTEPFDVIADKAYPAKELVLKVPYELKDEKSGEVALNVKLWTGALKSEESYTLTVQRPAYSTEVKSVTVPQTIEAGEILPVDVVLKNNGYNDLNDVYVTTKIVELGLEKTAYFGDMVAIKDPSDDNSKDSASGRLELQVPFGIKAGLYTLEIKVTSDDLTATAVKQIAIKNSFPDNVIVVNSKQTAAVGANAEYSLLIVNPTDKLQVYKVISESSADLTSSVSESVVAIPAGTSQTVKITATASTEGEHAFDVSVFSGSELKSTATLGLTANAKEGPAASSPIVVLTVILAIIFLVLLIVLIVLIGKKPEKAEEFGESYY